MTETAAAQRCTVLFYERNAVSENFFKRYNPKHSQLKF